jgi:mono/diheme cytochrome c family protein
MKLSRFSFLLFSIFLLTACSFSLAEDMTPPPGVQQQQSAVQPQPASQSGPLYPLIAPDPTDGQTIYVEKCAPCHGDQGLGDGPQAAQLPNPVAAIGSPDVARQAAPDQWYSVVTNGNLERFMPPFTSLSDRQRWDVVAYAYSLSASQADISKGAELFQANCARCHGANGVGDGPDAANLSVKPVDFTDQEFMAGKAAADFYAAISQGVSPEMPAFGNQLSEEDRWVLTDYLRTFTFNASGSTLAQAGTVTPPEGTAAVAGSATSAPQTTPVAGETPVPGITTTQVLSPTTALGNISGVVTNSSGGDVPSGMAVTLHGFDQMQTAITQTTTLKNDGSFLFDNVPMLPGRVFLTTVEFDGSTYGSDIATVETDTTSLDLPIIVYETTKDTSSLSVDRLHLFFEFADPNTMRVIELYIISNNSDKTVIAPVQGDPTITFKLPEGATNLEFQDGELGGRYVQTEGGFGDTVAIRPGSGSYQVLFAFEMPYNKKLDLAQPLDMPTNAVVVLVPAGSINVKGDNLQDGGVRPVQGVDYQTYNGSALNAGDVLRLSVTGSPAGSSSALTVGSKTNLLVGVGAFGFVLIAVGVFLFLRNRNNQFIEDDLVDDVAPSTGVGAENAETVMDAILALDDLYRAGELPEDAYRQRRAELKERLKELLD